MIDIGKFKFWKDKPKQADGFHFASAERIELPKIQEVKSKDYVSYGANNLYPKELMELTSTCAIHNAIVKTKSTMMAGSSITIDGTQTQEESDQYINSLPITDRVKYSAIINQFTAIKPKLSTDYQTFGAYAMEYVYSLDFTRIIQVNHIPVYGVRSGKMVNGKVEEYYYSRDWSNLKENPMVTFSAYTETNNKSHRQLLYRYDYSVNQEYYGKPSYQSALAWIKLDSEIGLFQLSNIENGMFPGLHMKFYKKPANKEEEALVANSLMKSYGTAKKAGKTFITFSDGKENAPEIEPIPVTDLDKQFIQMSEQAVQQILSAHRVTSPMLLGIATAGKLGYSNELENSIKIFESTVIEPDREMLEQDFNNILKYNGIKETIKLNRFNPIADI